MDGAVVCGGEGMRERETGREWGDRVRARGEGMLMFVLSAAWVWG